MREKERERDRVRVKASVCVSPIFLFCDFNLSIVGHGEQTNDFRLATPEPRQTKRAKGRTGRGAGCPGLPLLGSCS